MALALTGTPPITAAALNSAVNTELTTNWFPLPGVTTNSNATAGNVGEYISSDIVSGSAVSLTSSTAANVTSISLTAGDWEVFGQVWFTQSGGSISVVQGSINTTSATHTSDPGVGSRTSLPAAFSSAPLIPLATCRFSLASTTTIYLVATMGFSAGTGAAYGYIAGRRMR